MFKVKKNGYIYYINFEGNDSEMKLVKQISIFVENKSGKIADVLTAIGEKGVDICALSIADTSDFGIMRLIVNNPDAAYAAIKELGMAAKMTDVIAIAVADTPGGLAKDLMTLKNENVFIEYMYAFIGKLDSNAMVIIRPSDNDHALEVLKKSDIRVLDAEEVYKL